MGNALWPDFLEPLFDKTPDGIISVLTNSFTYRGINDDFIKSVQAQVTKGTLALFLITGDTLVDKVIAAMNELDFELIGSNLSRKQETQLKATFVHE